MIKVICHHQKGTAPPLKGYRATTKRVRALGRKLHLFSSYRASRVGTPEVVPPTIGIYPSSDTPGQGEYLRSTTAIFAFRCSTACRRRSASVPLEAGVVDNMAIMRRTSQATDNTIVADTKKRDILNRRENTICSARFNDSSRFGLVLRHIFPLGVDNMAKPAFGIPSILGAWRQK